VRPTAYTDGTLTKQVRVCQYRPAGGGAAHWRKHLEFPAGGDQRVTVTRVGTIKAQHLNTTIYRTITMYIVIEVLGGSAGGLYKRFRQCVALPPAVYTLIFFPVVKFLIFGYPQ
jgi:hypothetical protein